MALGDSGGNGHRWRQTFLREKDVMFAASASSRRRGRRPLRCRPVWTWHTLAARSHKDLHAEVPESADFMFCASGTKTGQRKQTLPITAMRSRAVMEIRAGKYLIAHHPTCIVPMLPTTTERDGLSR